VLETVERGAAEFDKAIDECVRRFSTNALCRAVNEAQLTEDQYTTLLKVLHGQVLSGPITFAIAASHCDATRPDLRAYLLRHASEEEGHYRWIEHDLHSLGKGVADPLAMPIVTESYVAYNEFVARRSPIRRLAIAAMLETLGGTIGGGLARKALSCLELRVDQASFFASHATTDAVHMIELREIIQTCRPDGTEWSIMAETARHAAGLYSAMYEFAAQGY
jgi:hypothetical protein